MPGARHSHKTLPTGVRAIRPTIGTRARIRVVLRNSTMVLVPIPMSALIIRVRCARAVDNVVVLRALFGT